MKLITPKVLRRATMLLPALSLMLAPLAAQAREEQDPGRRNPEDMQSEMGVGGRGGAIGEFNFGPVGMNLFKQQEKQPSAGGSRLLSGRVIELKGQTLYVERGGVVVPLDLSALRITKQPKPGQQIIAGYSVDRTRNIALSLAGEVAANQ